MAESSKGSKRSHYTDEEDLGLARAFVAVSHDPKVGVDQKYEVFWKKVASEFQRLVPESIRLWSALPHRWSTIHNAVGKFSGYYAKVEEKNESGKEYEDYVNDALIMFKELEKKPFRHRFVWEFLRRASPKFAEVKQPTKKRQSNVVDDPCDSEDNFPSSGTSNCFAPSDESDRPIGIKKAKLETKLLDIEQKTSKAIVDLANSQKQFFNTLSENFNSFITSQNSITKKELSLKEQESELALFSVNIDSLDDEAKQYLKEKRKKAQEKLLQERPSSVCTVEKN
uniref:No apical meristem-associated C-terminal domain-containing protein n=1 Tax=Timspurckia oligopyrenoides TaxID=708627 RepID=A0A7S1ERD2_9RHOD|mmetsp:Transcript_1422/g.2585  ORF Transcript_1422/g.2585 Transcript_1422/m.2585 type:complete len:283 (+) Transcript_1422:76-924(+)|eukprot:CAMPEP_0182445992 /NCGR_PEP_ID=MMETSP1172-20130603/3914_1 /TAXON_ID=708627 /ORGANISM="Timspurckia oligopyrenoides, Strain CCMP3278" /LENGTH=282 /DNA_ID=CAMNT_0024641847 /DNA_START=70 /DNA_END=918 /DNA_ORIENTATION=-